MKLLKMKVSAVQGQKKYPDSLEAMSLNIANARRLEDNLPNQYTVTLEGPNHLSFAFVTDDVAEARLYRIGDEFFVEIKPVQ